MKNLRDKIYEAIAKEFVPERFSSGGEARRLVDKMWKLTDKICKLLDSKETE